MPEKTVRGIPIIGTMGLKFILGAIVGVVFHRLIALVSQKWAREGNAILETSIVGGFKYCDLIVLGLPLVLIVVVRRFKAFFIGWFVSILAIELGEWAHGGGIPPFI